MKIIPLFSIILFLYSATASAGLYRWIDAEGGVHYSDKIPPAAAKHGHVELNISGIKKKTSLSLEQKQKIAAREAQKKKELKEKRERDRQAAIKKMQDEQLLSIYSSKKELVNVYEGKIKMASSSIVLLKKRHKTLSDRLAKTEIKQEKMKNPKFKETLAKKIDDMLDGLKVYQQAITENMVEKNKLEKQYALNIERFNSLTKKDKPAVKATRTDKTKKALQEIVSKALSSKVLLKKKYQKKKLRLKTSLTSTEEDAAKKLVAAKLYSKK